MTEPEQADRDPEADHESAPRRFVEAGLARLGLAAADDEIAVILAADALYGAPLEALLDAELDGVEPEPGADLSKAPRSPDRR